MIREGGMLVVPEGLGYEKLAVSVAAGLADIPSPSKDIRRTVVHVEDGEIRWLATGADPSSTEGLRLSKDSILVYDGDPSKLRFIALSGLPVLFVHYFGVI